MSDQPRRSELQEMTETTVVCALVLVGMYLVLGLAYWLLTGGWTWNPAQMVTFLPDSSKELA